jgi:four helix bundle protein
MALQHYRELVVWQKAIDFAEMVYRATREFPRDELFGLTSQLRRAAVSVASNIAEGQGRGTTKDFIHFLHIANGSLQECETQLVLAERFGYLEADGLARLLEQSNEVGRINNGLIRSLSARR